MQNSTLAVSLFLLSAGLSLPALAQQDLSKLSDRERIERLERMVEGQGLVDLLLRVDTLQQEVQKLQGSSDINSRAIEDIKKRQRDLYIDIDRRLLQLERQNPSSASAVTPVSPNAVTPVSPVGQQVPSVPAGNTTMSPVDEAAEQQAYQKAFDLLRELRYDNAIEQFRKFLQQYPDGRYAHIAQYWLGEANYAQSRFSVAIEDYKTLLKKYPNTPKQAQAMLKIGYSYYKLNNLKAARASFNQVVAGFPGTTEAGQARKMLKELKLKNK